jgi:tetratricopeptide (TPR) repeat protein
MDTNEAIERFNATLGSCDQEPEAHYARGLLYALEGKFEAAKEAYQCALALDERSGFHYSMAVLCFQNQEPEIGYQHLKRALAMQPQRVSMRLRAAQLCLRHGLHDGVIEIAEEALKLNPGPRLAVTFLGWISQVQAATGNLQLAIEASTRAMQYTQQDARLLNNIGVLHLRLGEVSKAIRVLQNALNVDPGLEVAARNLSLALRLHQ